MSTNFCPTDRLNTRFVESVRPNNISEVEVPGTWTEGAVVAFMFISAFIKLFLEQMVKSFEQL